MMCLWLSAQYRKALRANCACLLNMEDLVYTILILGVVSLIRWEPCHRSGLSDQICQRWWEKTQADYLGHSWPRAIQNIDKHLL